jgi:CRISPR-associated protein Csh2
MYESTYSVPNGDPFTGEQRYDDETRKILVSDVRIKRFIHDYFVDQGQDVFVVSFAF